jgi:hypothetical protein
MPTRAVPVDREEEDYAAEDVSLSDVLFLAFPKATYAALSNEAAKRGHTIAQALQIAIADYLKEGKNG